MSGPDSSGGATGSSSGGSTGGSRDGSTSGSRDGSTGGSRDGSGSGSRGKKASGDYRLTRKEVAQMLDIPMEMAIRHDLPTRMTSAEYGELDRNPPAWLAQSRANRTGKRPVWTVLTCGYCDFSEQARPKKWWPEWTFLLCDHHAADVVPPPAADLHRDVVYGIGTRFVALVDTPA